MISEGIRSPLLFAIAGESDDANQRAQVNTGERGGGSAGEKQSIQKTYFDVLGICCSSEIVVVEKILTSLDGVIKVSVIVPSKTVIVVHDSTAISPSTIAHQEAMFKLYLLIFAFFGLPLARTAKVLNQSRLEANVRAVGELRSQKKWPNLYVIACGLLLGLSFLKYVYSPLEWFAVAAVAVGIWPVLIKCFAAIRNLTIDLNSLIIIEVAGTLALKDFWEAGTIVFLFAVAEWLQSHASHKASSVMSSLMSIAPQKATIADTGEQVNVELLKPGTIIAVKTGEVIAMDGIVVEGSCEVDEKTLTGEPFPVPKEKDSVVWAGTINLNGYICIKTTAISEDCVVVKMVKLVEEAQNKKSRFQRVIDEWARYYTPVVVLISAAMAAVPAAMEVDNKSYWCYLALVVLVSACPCGLILSTPVATFCALSNAATNGLLVKGGDYIETLARVKTMAFDKTGTITRGEFIITGFRCLAADISAEALLYWVASIENKSSHPIADAILHYCKSQSIEPRADAVEEFRNFPGEGIAGMIEGKDIYVGNRKFGKRAGCSSALEFEHGSDDGRTLAFVYSGGAVIGIFSLSDACRTGAVEAIKDLRSMGIRTAMLTGDSHSAATQTYVLLERAFDEVHAELLPEDKARIVEDYKKTGLTAMVGDGVNDAPALATADVGISMGVSGSALATETGHVILMSNDIRRIPNAVRLAKRTQHKVIQNILFSILIKAVVLVVALAGHPIVWVAVLADVLSCLLVIFNSMLLLNHSHDLGVIQSSSPMPCCSNASGNEGTCSKSSVSNVVHDHNRTLSSSSNVATKRSKAATCSSGDLSCKSKKCGVDPLIHQHQQAGGGSGVEKVKLQCCSMKSGAQRVCRKEECSDLEGQGCLGSSTEENNISCKAAEASLTLFTLKVHGF